MNSIEAAKAPTKEELLAKGQYTRIVRGKPKVIILKESPAERYWKMAVRRDGCWDWNGCKAQGYGKMAVNGRAVTAHRVSAVLHFGAVPDSMFVLHKCDNRACSNPEHLYIGNSQDNVDDMFERGRACIGSINVRSKLTEEKVLEIRKLMGGDNRPTKESLAKKFGVARTTIAKVVAGESWRHVK